MTNKERAELGEIIIAHARGLFGDVHAEFDVLVTDILTDLMHACDQGEQMPSFDNCLRIASMHHDAEVIEEVAPEIEKSFGVKLPEKTNECQDCGRQYPDLDLLPVHDIWSRIAPGDIFPSGECPHCGALCLPIVE
jgi:hypothetical protein